MLSPEEAKRFLAGIFTDKASDEEKRFAFIAYHVQGEIMKGQHAEELAQIHQQEWTERNAGNQERAAELRANYDAIVGGIASAIEQQLEQLAAEGKEMPWTKWPD